MGCWLSFLPFSSLFSQLFNQVLDEPLNGSKDFIAHKILSNKTLSMKSKFSKCLTLRGCPPGPFRHRHRSGHSTARCSAARERWMGQSRCARSFPEEEKGGETCGTYPVVMTNIVENYDVEWENP